MPDQEMRNPQDARAAAIFAAVCKFRDLHIEWHSALQEQEHGKIIVQQAKERKRSVNAQYAQLVAMAELFGFDVQEEFRKDQERQQQLPNQSPSANQIVNMAEDVTEENPKTVKEHAIRAAELAYPNSIRASTLRQKLEEMGIKVHEKTVGMTLYRLSKDGMLRRDGWDWFFVPEDERRPAAPQGEESPGDEPGLLLRAAE